MAVLLVALLTLLAMIAAGFVNVTAGGGQSKATAYARQKIEELRSQPINAPCPAQGCFPPADGTDSPEAGVGRSWTIAQVGPTGPPNRLWRITVSVNWRTGSQVPQSIAVETMRAE